MILLLRGHIRSSFDDNELYNLLKHLSEEVDTLDIYIQTWNIFQSNVSWREMKENNTIVTESLIYNYFRDIPIKNIIILDDKQIVLTGNVEGKIPSTTMPLRGWKNMWFGIYEGIKYITDNCPDDFVINMRFDVLNNSNSFPKDETLSFILRKQINVKSMEFVVEKKPILGVDNIFIGKASRMLLLCARFQFELDVVLLYYPELRHQEFMVFFENKKLKNIPIFLPYKEKEKFLNDKTPPEPEKNIVPIPKKKLSFNGLVITSLQNTWGKFIKQ